MATERISGFDPQAESRYIRGLDKRVRRDVFESEIASTAAEEFLVKFTRDYDLKEGHLVDDQSGEGLAELTGRGGRREEIEAVKKIEELMGSGEKLVINFSPADEKWGYPDNYVDFWKTTNKGKIRWIRMKVENNWQGLIQVWKNLGGEEEIETGRDLLSRPIGTERRMADVLRMLDLAYGRNLVSQDDIKQVTNRLVEDFVREYGDIWEDPLLVFRLFSAVMAETERVNKMMDGKSWGKVDLNDLLESRRVDDYLWGEMIPRQRATGGCAGFNMVGEFGGKGQYYTMETSDGVKVVKGEVPEGYSFCTSCGIWYKGSVCPFCD